LRDKSFVGILVIGVDFLGVASGRGKEGILPGFLSGTSKFVALLISIFSDLNLRPALVGIVDLDIKS
jgi:hypothetical protein